MRLSPAARRSDTYVQALKARTIISEVGAGVGYPNDGERLPQPGGGETTRSVSGRNRASKTFLALRPATAGASRTARPPRLNGGGKFSRAPRRPCARARPSQHTCATTMATSSDAGASPRKARTSASTASMRSRGARLRCRRKDVDRRSSPKNSPWRFCASVMPSV